MEQRYTSDVISLWEKNRIIYLKLGRSFRDAGFDFYFGRIQNSLRKSQAVALRVFFDQCEWADPLPMMALAAELFLWCSEHDKQTLPFVPWTMWWNPFLPIFHYAPMPCFTSPYKTTQKHYLASGPPFSWEVFLSLVKRLRPFMMNGSISMSMRTL